MNTSFKRYWEPSMPQVLGLSLPIGALTTLITQPIEFVKTRTQIRTEGVGLRGRSIYQGVNPHKVFREIHATGGGFSQFYYGTTAALQSRLGYLFIRNFLYKFIYDRTKPLKPFNDLTTREKAVLSSFAGGVGALLTSPFELVMTRQIADGGIPQQYRRNYTSSSQAIAQIRGEEGVRGLFKGASSNVVRAIVLNSTLTGCYDYLNEKCWITFGDFGFNEPLSLAWAAFWGTLFTLPFDNVKTRVMRQFNEPHKNRLTYLNYSDVIQQVLRHEGWTGFYSGAFAFYGKMIITAGLTVYLTDSVTSRIKRNHGLKEWQI